MEGQRQEELKSLQEEKEQLKKLVEKQSGVIEELKQQLQRTSEENSVLQQQQHELAEMVNNLMQSMKSPTCEWAPQLHTTHGESDQNKITQPHKPVIR